MAFSALIADELALVMALLLAFDPEATLFLAEAESFLPATFCLGMLACGWLLSVES